MEIYQSINVEEQFVQSKKRHFNEKIKGRVYYRQKVIVSFSVEINTLYCEMIFLKFTSMRKGAASYAPSDLANVCNKSGFFWNRLVRAHDCGKPQRTCQLFK